MARGPIPDKPRDRPTVPQVLPLAKAYYGFNGRNLHIVLADGNLEDESVAWCRERCRQRGDEDGVRLASLLLSMTGTQRRRIYRSV